MTASWISLLVFLLACGGLRAGRAIARRLPDRHLATSSRNAAQAGIGMLATLAALVLGLMITSAKTSFDLRNLEIIDIAASMVLLDRALAGYGPESAAARAELRDIHRAVTDRVSPGGALAETVFHAPLSTLGAITHLQQTILALDAQSEAQRWFKARALTLTSDVGHVRALTAERGDASIPGPLLVVITAWVLLIFVGMGVFVMENRSIAVVMVTAALSFACAIFVILELDTPYAGVIGVSSRPLDNAATELGR